MPIIGTLDLDTVSGAEIESDIGSGRIVRTGLIHHVVLPPGSTPTQYAMSDALQIAGMPQKGDSWDSGIFSDWFLKRHIIRAVTAHTYTVTLIYEFRGLRVVRDSTSLVGITTDIDPIQQEALYVTYQPPPNGTNTLPLRTLAVDVQTQRPVRHLTVQQTVSYEAQSNVLTGLRSVNDDTWQGYDKGWWLCTSIEGESMDNGETFTYSATFSSWMDMDWSQYKIMTNPDGVKIVVDPTIIATLMAMPYVQGQTHNDAGILKFGAYPTADFPTLFGLGATAALLPIDYAAP